MFPRRFFPAAYFAPRFFPQSQGSEAAIRPISGSIEIQPKLQGEVILKT
jgi:hypothetical protein